MIKQDKNEYMYTPLIVIRLTTKQNLRNLSNVYQRARNVLRNSEKSLSVYKPINRVK